MKTPFSLLFILISILLNAQISTTRMNDLKLGMPLEEVQSLLGQKLELSLGEDDWGHTTKVNHKGNEFILRFAETTEDGKNVFYSLFEIETISKNIKTLSKVGVGSNIDDLWKSYKKYDISVWRHWNPDTENYLEKERTFQLIDNENGTSLYFYLTNDIVTKIILGYFEGC